MSLNRSLLRMATVAAISNFMQAPYPTLAGQHIFDSKIEPVNDVQDDVQYPMVVVYTDYDRDYIGHGTLRKVPRLMTITIEMLVAIITDRRDDGGYSLAYPQIDSELEISLDILEHQVFEALQANNAAADCYRAMVYGVETIISRRGATVEGGQKLAARQLTLEVSCLREPTTGVLPEYAEKFLDAIDEVAETNPGYEFADRTAVLRSAYQDNAAGALNVRRARQVGYTQDDMDKLLIEDTPTVLVPPITWVGP